MTSFGLTAIPRKWCSEKLFARIISIFGGTIICKRPWRWLIFYEFTPRDEMFLAEASTMEEWGTRVDAIKQGLRW